MSQKNMTTVKELIAQVTVCLDLAKGKLRDISRAIDDPNFLKDSMKIQQLELSKKIDELLNAQITLQRRLDNE